MHSPPTTIRVSPGGVLRISDAQLEGVAWLKRLITSDSVLGSCSRVAKEQMNRSLQSERVAADTQNLLGSVLESESVQHHAADFVWRVLTRTASVKSPSSEGASDRSGVAREDETGETAQAVMVLAERVAMLERALMGLR